MKRTILACLAAALVAGVSLPVQAAEMEKTEISFKEARHCGFYEESVQPSAAPWIRVEDRRWGIRADGRILYWGSYPELHADTQDHPAVERVLQQWNNAQREKYDVSAAYLGQKDDEEMRKYGPFYEYETVARWGRVDDHIVSFALYYGFRDSFENPQFSQKRTMNINVVTGKQIAIDEIVTGRDELFAALASIFRAAYPAREESLYEMDVDKTLASRYSDADWKGSLHWMLNADNDLVVLFNPYDLIPAAAGALELTVRRSEYPAVFR